MRDEGRIREEAPTEVRRSVLHVTAAVLVAFAVGMFIAGFFVGKEYSTFMTKRFTADDPREGKTTEVAKAPRIEEEFLKRYEPTLHTEGQEELIKRDPKLKAMVDRVQREEERLDAIPPKPTAPPPPAAITPDPPAPIVRTGEGAPPSDFAEGRFTLQLTAGKREEAAVEELDLLKQKGYATAFVSKSNDWYRVRIGRFETQEQVEAFRDWFKEREGKTLFPSYVDR